MKIWFNILFYLMVAFSIHATGIFATIENKGNQISCDDICEDDIWRVATARELDYLLIEISDLVIELNRARCGNNKELFKKISFQLHEKMHYFLICFNNRDELQKTLQGSGYFARSADVEWCASRLTSVETAERHIFLQMKFPKEHEDFEFNLSWFGKHYEKAVFDAFKNDLLEFCRKSACLYEKYMSLRKDELLGKIGPDHQKTLGSLRLKLRTMKSPLGNFSAWDILSETDYFKSVAKLSGVRGVWILHEDVEYLVKKGILLPMLS